MANTPALDFWFEFASTYSYPAAMRIGALARARGVIVRWRPFLLGPVFKAQGWDNSPFNIYPVKGRYMWRDLERICAAAGLPFVRPAVFPQNTILAARVALVALGEGWGEDFSCAVYAAEFGEAFGVQKLMGAESFDSLRFCLRGFLGEIVFLSHFSADDCQLLRHLVLEFLDLGARLAFAARLQGVSRFERRLALGDQVVSGLTLRIGEQILQLCIGERLKFFIGPFVHVHP